MVEHQAEYPWSSYGVNAHGLPNSLIQPHPLYLDLGSTPSARAAAYRGLFRVHLDPGLVDQIRSATFGNYALGSPLFAEQVVSALHVRASRGKDGRPKKTSPQAR